MRQHNKIRKNEKPIPRATGHGAAQIWIGIDLGDRWSEACLLNDAGEVIGRTRVRTTQQGFRTYFTQLAGARVALETGTHSGWASRVLAECGLTATVANAREVRKIHQSHRKNDRNDAEILARMLRFDPRLLSPIHHRDVQMQNDITVLRARDVMVRARTMQINAMRGLIKSHGERLPACSSDSFARRVAEHIPPELQPALVPLLETIAGLTAQIRAYDRLIETFSQQRYPQTAVLRQVAGVGPVTALAFVLTLSSKDRFSHSRDVGPYLGLVPRQYDSGDRQSQLPISKAGNKYLRRLLVGSAQYILGAFGPDCDLRSYGQRLMERGAKNAKKRAVVAVARKLAILLHHLWTTGALYEPLYNVPKPLAA
jgi:transposase